jgi:hypothetical protein
VNYARSYRDTESAKNRELDIQAVVGAYSKSHNSVLFSTCIECKSSRTKPWVALSNGTTLGKDGLEQIAMGTLGQMTISAANAEGIRLPVLFKPDVPKVGGVVQALTEKQDGSPTAPYAAIQQARSAALALDSAYQDPNGPWSSGANPTGIFLPIVILDGHLLEYSIDQDFNESVKEVDVVMASVAGDATSDDAVVPIITERYATTIAQEMYTSVHNFCVAMLPHASVIAASMKIDQFGDSV